MSQMKRIEVKDLQFSYADGSPVLKGLTFSLDERPVALIGQNGAGKTTFVKLLKGLLRPSAGHICFEGQDIADMTVAGLAKDIGLVFQNPDDQIFENTVLDEVMFGPLQIGMETRQAKASSLEALKVVGLQGQEMTNPYDLGLSDRKMVSIAAVLAMQTDVVILDEPTIAQDYEGKERLKKIIADLAANHTIVISILHDMDFVAEVFQRVIVLADGKVALDSTPREVFANQELLKAAHLSQPSVTQLCRALGSDEVFLSTDEFVRYYQSLKRG